METLVYTVGVDYWRFELHPKLMQQTLTGAPAAGVRRVVLIGTVYPYGYPQQTPAREDHPREPHTFKGKMRKAQEDVLMAAHASGQLEATILRLPDFYGPGVDKSLLHNAFVGASGDGKVNMIGPLDQPHEFVFVPDVGPAVLRLAQTAAAFGHSWHLAGAAITTQREILDEIEKQAGRKLKVRVAGKTLLRLAGLFSPLMREMVEMHYLMTRPILLDDSALQELIGPVHKTPYAEGVRQCLAAL